MLRHGRLESLENLCCAADVQQMLLVKLLVICTLINIYSNTTLEAGHLGGAQVGRANSAGVSDGKRGLCDDNGLRRTKLVLERP
jgi:hypothetical protein